MENVPKINLLFVNSTSDGRSKTNKIFGEHLKIRI